MIRCRLATWSAALVLGCGSAGALALATPAQADGGTGAVALSQIGANAYALSLSVAGTAIVIDYTLNGSGQLTSATTSAPGATVSTAGDEIRAALVDGTVVQVELGGGGTSVDSVETESPEPTESPEATHSPEPTESPEATHSPEPTESPEATHSPDATSSDSSSTDSSGGSGSDG
ncbi:MAG TPA: hypothetical protein VNG13_15250 [Mycobacteriales bacterium]|nr:hypothetical protein [Mycobacteriales bacterium]